MEEHTKIYREFFGLGEQSICLCEMCGKLASEIHHIKFRSQGGKNNIENLIALCRWCHNDAHGKGESKLEAQELTDIHQKNVKFILNLNLFLS